MSLFPSKNTENAPARQPVFVQPVQDDWEDELDQQPDPAEDWSAEPMDYEEEQRERRRDRLRIAAGIGDFFGVVAGVAVTLVLVALLIALVNWVHADLTQSFTLLGQW